MISLLIVRGTGYISWWYREWGEFQRIVATRWDRLVAVCWTKIQILALNFKIICNWPRLRILYNIFVLISLQWLRDDTDRVPKFATHRVSVAGLVFHQAPTVDTSTSATRASAKRPLLDTAQILFVREKVSHVRLRRISPAFNCHSCCPSGLQCNC